MTNLSKTYTGQAKASLTDGSEVKDLSIRPGKCWREATEDAGKHTQGILTQSPTVHEIIPSHEPTNGMTRH